MSGSGPGEWQHEAEYAAHICDQVSSDVLLLALNADKAYVLQWLRNAKVELGRANEALERAIGLADTEDGT